MSLFAIADVAFLQKFVERHGFWPLTLICMLPMLAFCVYVKLDDWRTAKAQKREPRGH